MADEDELAPDLPTNLQEETVLEVPGGEEAQPAASQSTDGEKAAALAARVAQIKPTTETPVPAAQTEPVPRAISDEVLWQTRTVQEFPESAEGNTTFAKVMDQKLQDLRNGGYNGADATYIAAQRAHLDPLVSRERNAGVAREQSIQRSSGFPRPHSQREERPSDELRTTPLQRQQMERLGITTPEGQKVYIERLKREAKVSAERM